MFGPQKSSAALGSLPDGTFKSLVTTQAANASPRITDSAQTVLRSLPMQSKRRVVRLSGRGVSVSVSFSVSVSGSTSGQSPW